MIPLRPTTVALAAMALALPLSGPARAQQMPPSAVVPVAPATGYADMVDLTLASPIVADVVVRSAARIKGAEAANVAPGRQRFYVQADVGALVRGEAGLPPRVGFLLDVAADARGRVASPRKQRLLIFARRVPGAADQLQLAGSRAAVSWTAGDDAQARRIARDLVAAEAPPAITGIGNAFHVRGALPGEGETQIFLQTANGRPVSLSILRRPGEQPRWSVALGEIVDEGAGPPARDTLLWYRLACGLPATLPAASVESLAPEDAGVAREDYRFVVDSLGPCGRSRAMADNAVSGGDGPA